MKKIYLFDCLKVVYKIVPVPAAVILLLKVFLALVPAAQTLLVAGFVDRVAQLQKWSFDRELFLIICLLVILVAYSWVSKSLTVLLEQRIEMKVRADFKPYLIEKICRLKYEYMENSDTRDKISRVNKEMDRRVREAYMGMLTLLELVLKVFGILIIMLTQVWWVAILIFLISVPCFYIAIRSGKEGYDAEAEVTRNSRMYEYFSEMLKGRDFVEERTLFCFGPEYRERFAEQYEIVRKHKTKVRFKWLLKMKAGSMATIIVSAALILFLVPLTIEGKLSLGMFMALINAVFGIVQNMSWDLAWAIDRNTWFNEYFKEMREVFSLEEDGLPSGTKAGAEAFQTLEFRDVSFRYPGTENYILKKVSFTIQAGKKYAFVGANGAGKTTLIKLVNGLYKDYEGEILVNGRNIHEYGGQPLATVFQDFARYPLALKENIAIAKGCEVSDSEIEQAISDVGLKETADRLKNGIHTGLGKYKKDSQDLSGGEWQKVALARCLLSDAPLKILDEPTAAMDPVYETMIYHKFKQISQNKTVLLISHRLASVKMSDIIFVLDGGQIVEEGTHQQLMAKGGLYKTMYTEQSKWYEEAGELEVSYE